MPPAIQPDSRKAAVLDVAARLFYEQGFHATGIKQIIEAAGIAKGTFYSHFKSKDEIGVAWLQARHHQWMQMLDDHLATLDPAPCTQLLGIFDFLKEWMEGSEYRGCAFLNTMAEIPGATHPMRKEIADHKTDLHRKITGLVKTAFPDHSEEQQEHIAAMTFINFEGALIQAQNYCKPWPIETARHQLDLQLC